MELIEQLDSTVPRALVLTALGLEAKAVLSHLTDRKQYVTDAAIYECGYFHGDSGTWLVAVAEIGPGNTESAAHCLSGIRDLAPIDLVAFVGIAGSLKPDDARLGDVISATKAYRYQGGKSTADGFLPRPAEAPVEASLQQVARTTSREGKWITRIQSVDGVVLDDYPCEYPPNALVAAIASGEVVIVRRQRISD